MNDIIGEPQGGAIIISCHSELEIVTLVEKTSFAAVFWPLFAAVLAPSNSDSSK